MSQNGQRVIASVAPRTTDNTNNFVNGLERRCFMRNRHFPYDAEKSLPLVARPRRLDTFVSYAPGSFPFHVEEFSARWARRISLAQNDHPKDD